jgi:hypothetical protein
VTGTLTAVAHALPVAVTSGPRLGTHLASGGWSMRRGTWRGLLVGAVLGVVTAALAEAPPAVEPAPASATSNAAAAAWDDSHMQSRYEPVRPTNRPRIEGETGYALLARGGSEARKEVEPELEFTSQRQWTQGSLSGSGSSSGTASSLRSGATGGVHRSGRSGTPSSALRAGSVHSSN